MSNGIDPQLPTPLDPAIAGFKKPESEEEVREVANKLEGVFLSMMLQKLREAMTEDGLFGSVPGADTFSGLFDQMMGEEMSRRGGLGISEMVLQSVRVGDQVRADESAESVAVETGTEESENVKEAAR